MSEDQVDAVVYSHKDTEGNKSSTDQVPCHVARDCHHERHSSAPVSLYASSKCNHVPVQKHMAIELDVFPFAYALRQQILGSIVV